MVHSVSFASRPVIVEVALMPAEFYKGIRVSTASAKKVVLAACRSNDMLCEAYLNMLILENESMLWKEATSFKARTLADAKAELINAEKQAIELARAKTIPSADAIARKEAALLRMAARSAAFKLSC